MQSGTSYRRAGVAFGLWAACLGSGLALRAEAEPVATSGGIDPLTPLPAAAAVATPERESPATTPAAVANTRAMPQPLADPLTALRDFEQQAFPAPREPAAGVVVDDADDGPATMPGTLRRDAHLSSWNPTAELRLHADDGGAEEEALPGAEPPSHELAQLRLPDLPIRWDPKLIRYLEFYRRDPRGRAILGTWLARLGRYAPLIESRLAAHDLPRALIYVAMIESAFDPSRTSPAGAAGLWQFMSSTGRGYGLRRDSWIDERRNPERATDAALRYLKNLYRRLGSWELALAAYNAGFGAVVAAMQKYNTNDYWRLCRYEAGLPWDTTLYVPKILAAAIVGHNRRFFGYQDVVADAPLTYDLISVRRSLSLTELAQASGSTSEQLRLLNPELRRGRTPPHVGVWVRVPQGTGTRVQAALQRTRPGSARYASHELRLGETIEELALRHGTTARALRQLNGLPAHRPLRAGISLLVPRAAPPAATPRAPDANTAPSETTAAATASTVGDDAPVVALPDDVPTAVAGRRRVFYRTVVGDTLPRVAQQFAISTAELVRWNGLDPRARLVSKMVLQAFVAPDFSTEHIRLLPADRVQLAVAGSDPFLDAHEQRKGRRRQVYFARPGDTLTRVARRLGVSLGDLMRINGLGAGAALLAGQRLLVYLPHAPLARSATRASTAASDRVASNAPP